MCVVSTCSHDIRTAQAVVNAHAQVCHTVPHVAAALKAWSGYSGDAAAAVSQFESTRAKGSLQAAFGKLGCGKPAAASLAAAATGDQRLQSPAGGSNAAWEGSPDGATTVTPAATRPNAATVDLQAMTRPSASMADAASRLSSATGPEASPAPAGASLAQPSASPMVVSPGSQPPSPSHSAGSDGTGSPNVFAAMMAASRSAAVGCPIPMSPQR